ncbi:MAG: pyridoxamine 5'-phosphate oxidase family protein, partial [Jatrophihabitantaceae bacterium]
MPPDSPSVAVLDEQDCLSLLRHGEVGRLATAVAGQPDIFPINYVLDGHSVVFCTAEGTKLAATFANTLVAFECDGYDSEAGDAWSVVIKGHAREISMHDLLESTFALYSWS